MFLNHKVTNIIFNLFSGLILFLAMTPAAYSSEVIGWVENVGISHVNTIVRAKIDTGADSSSLHCDCITPYEKDGDQWVRFSITDVEGESVSYERKIIGNVTIKRHFGDSQQRYVVRMGFCIGKVYAETDVNLVDRSGFSYDLLIGRKFLKDRFIVDSSKEFTTRPSCDVDS